MEADQELAQLRLAMDVCNRRLAAVLHERDALARRIGDWKRAHGLAAVDPGREAAMLARLADLADPNGFSAAALQRLFAAVFAESRALVEQAGRAERA
jgi:chorismate mutase